MFTILILAGGSGTRLWPLSRKEHPKQFLSLTDNKYTMLQQTIIRVMNLEPDRIIIICHKMHNLIVQQQINDLKINTKNIFIITEPLSQNTAPPIAIICKLSYDNDTILVLPSDHVFDDKLFINTIKQGMELINQGIVIFGVKPTYPEIGYGYIEYYNNNVVKFIEKPNIVKAIEYFTDGKHLWNTGVFLFNCNIMINEFKLYAHDIWDNVDSNLNDKIFINNILHIEQNFYENLRNISIDYAIMEHHNNGKVIKYDGKWNDIGSFKSLYAELPKNNNNNYIDGDVQAIDTTNCYIKSNVTTVTIGINNLVIFNTSDCLLVANIDECHKLRQVAVEFEKRQKLE